MALKGNTISQDPKALTKRHDNNDDDSGGDVREASERRVVVGSVALHGSPDSMSRLGRFVRTSLQVAVGVGTGILLVDACEELSLWYKCRQIVTGACRTNEELKAEIGEPIEPGQYWDSSLRLTHKGNLLHATLPVHGSKGASDVQIKLVKKGKASFGNLLDFSLPGENLVYNHLGSGEWDVLVHYAVIGGAGALPKHFDLLQQPPPAKPEEPKGDKKT